MPEKDAAVPQIRAVTLTNYIEIAQLLQLDPFELLRHASLHPAWLEDPEHRIPAKSAITLLEESAARSGCESFGLLMAERRSFPSLGPLALLLDRLDTVRDCVEALKTYRRHLNDVLDIGIEEFGDTSIVRLDFIPEFSCTQGVDLTLGVGFRALVGASQGAWSPSMVHVVRKAPTNTRPWQRMFHAPVEFESGFNGFSCPTTALSIGNPLADKTMAEHAKMLLDLMPINPQDAPVTDRTRRVIANLLPKGATTAEQVASNMGVSVRGLQRNLEQEGETFGALLNQVRRQLARYCLEDTDQSITSIAEQTGYSSLSSFTRWFTSEFGHAPQVWRSTQRGQLSNI